MKWNFSGIFKRVTIGVAHFRDFGGNEILARRGCYHIYCCLLPYLLLLFLPLTNGSHYIPVLPKTVTKMGYIIGHKIDYNGVGVLTPRGVRASARSTVLK